MSRACDSEWYSVKSIAGDEREVVQERGTPRSFTPRANFKGRRSSRARLKSLLANRPLSNLRFLQSLVEASAANNSTVIVPLPIDLLRRFLG
jgi:hypothetical protein